MRLFALFMSAVTLVAAGSPGRALYSCAFSGKRNLERCCCEGSGAPAAGDACRKTCCGSAERDGAEKDDRLVEPPAPIPVEGGSFGVFEADRCCTVTYQKTRPAAPSPRDGAAGWKERLDQGRLEPASLPAILVEALLGVRPAAREAAPWPGDPSGLPPPPDLPLYLTHRALLI